MRSVLIFLAILGMPAAAVAYALAVYYLTSCSAPKTATYGVGAYFAADLHMGPSCMRGVE